MAIGIEKCPFCGGNILKGALKCTSCGKLLTTAEQQQEAIEKHKDTNSETNYLGLIIKLAIIIATSTFVYKNYSSILETLKNIMK